MQLLRHAWCLLTTFIFWPVIPYSLHHSADMICTGLYYNVVIFLGRRCLHAPGVCFLFQVKTSEYSRTSRCLWRQITLLSNNGVVSMRIKACGCVNGMGCLLSFQVKTSQYSGTSRCLWGQFIRLSNNRIVSTNDMGLSTLVFPLLCF